MKKLTLTSDEEDAKLKRFKSSEITGIETMF